METLDNITLILRDLNFTPPERQQQQHEDFRRIHEKFIDPLMHYMPPLMIVTSIIGNLLCLITLWRPPLKTCSIGYYLRVKCATDIGVLLMKPVIDWVAYHFNYVHPPNQSDTICRLWQFMWNMANGASTWLPVCMMTDRYIILWHPSKASERCNVFMAKVAMAMVFTGLVVTNIHAMWSALLDSGQCNQIDPIHPKLYESVWFWAAMIANYYLPLILLFVLDIAVVLGIIAKGGRSHYFGPMATEELEMTAVSTGVCVTFFLIATPEHICYIILEIMQHVVNFVIVYVTLHMSQLLSLLNYVHIFIFCASLSATFRTTLREIFIGVFRRKFTQSNYELAAANNNTESTALEIDNPTHSTNI